ncbi:hypothetical protein H0H87_007413, partial [Tephrocybe sp. NHM501043]
FVGYWPEQKTIVVAHEGTDPAKLVSLLTDANVLKVSLDRTLFPGVPGTVLVHAGFRNTHNLTATKILAEVNRLMISEKTKSVFV